ncbi:hypothetical protein [Caballeronia sordidicola]|uniref:hypothetical protein n=1 Tax=Caballeronia sordidicola TaxID=196367 RepID=UPI00117DFAFF|nr:hypothetical protein [Caballeronia sordidicola]
MWSQITAVVLKNPGPAIAALAGLAAAMIAACVAIFTQSRMLKIARANLKHSQEVLTEQRTANARAAASLLVDKRPKWIDDLNAEMAIHLSQSKTIIWKWDAVRRTHSEIFNDQIIPIEERDRKLDELRRGFAKGNSERETENGQRSSHLRLILRTNSPAQGGILCDFLDETRKVVLSAQGVKTPSEGRLLMQQFEVLSHRVEKLTSDVVLSELSRIQDAIVNPDEAMSKFRRSGPQA